MKKDSTIQPVQQSINKNLEKYRSLSDGERLAAAFEIKKEIQSIDVESGFIKVENKIHHNTGFARALHYLTRIAAILTLPLLAFTVWSLFHQYLQPEREETKITWQELQSPLGMRSHLKLPDGTDLWLNAGSTVKYGIPFTRETREIEMIGEAFLDVVKNNKAPFIVTSGNTKINVLGTAFNIKAYPEDKNLEVALKEGNIRFYFTNRQGKNVYCELSPDDHLILNIQDNTLEKDNRDISKLIAWYQNILVFDDTPMFDVASTLAKWYGVKVVIADKEILKYKITTTFENEPLFRVLELLELSSPISIKYTPGKLNKETHIADPSIVTITKK